ncbi:hypothetical protein CANARDRAFT_178250 [[Candida] arabinofermentans NRRL YB-2248]|uniref:Tryptophan--tRNA ligase, mitochondrial n=1 Tax=[Candida] arabinofermentans NRRL YB-2248 TaxID=983967 RepID=A0A1E4ST84_9ASCO|nr:hypothetical protein CANARDRAFT_178250 [[Candida] arabinofermentans NRRL YB-2248]
MLKSLRGGIPFGGNKEIVACGSRLFSTTLCSSLEKTVQTVPLISDPNYKIPNNSVLVSGIQPTGAFHLGNYLGATKSWKLLTDRVIQDEIDSTLIFFVADLHSITVPQDFSTLKKHRMEAIASIIACGVDPEKAIIYNQSAVPEHTQLQWVLNCFTSVGYLNRMTQWKSKSNIRETSDIIADIGKVRLGLFSYPVLMAADILLFNTTHCPVGLDQAQHLELTREIAESFNKETRSKFFNLPKTLLAPTSKVLSLRNPSKKMSKSDPDEMSRLSIIESPESIIKKIKKATTDSIEGRITYDPIERPGISNLLTIYAAIKNKTISTIMPDVEHLNKMQLKDMVSTAIIEDLKTPSELYNELIRDEERLQKLSDRGAERAREIAAKNLKEIYKIIGMN